MTRIERKLRKHLTDSEMALVSCKTNEVELDDSNLESGDLRERVSEITGWGGYSTGWGGFVFAKSYEVKGDWNEISSGCHY